MVREALELHERIRSPVLVAHTHAAWAALLADRDQGDDHDRARTMARRARRRDAGGTATSKPTPAPSSNGWADSLLDPATATSTVPRADHHRRRTLRPMGVHASLVPRDYVDPSVYAAEVEQVLAAPGCPSAGPIRSPTPATASRSPCADGP